MGDSRRSGSAGPRILFALIVVNLVMPAFGAGSAPVFLVNAGGPAYTDSAGRAWSADDSCFHCSGGDVQTYSNAVSGTRDPVLYQSARSEGTSTAGNSFSYAFPADNGRYRVTLKFAANSGFSAGANVQNVSINGNPVLTNFDVYALAGQAKALDESFDIRVSDGQIQILFTTVSGQAFVNAIDIWRIPPGKLRQDPLTSYNATTRQDYIAPPPAPRLEAAPYTFYDPNPAFSTTRLLRATDGNTLGSANTNGSFLTYAGNGNAFNANTTKFVAKGIGGAQNISQYYVFDFDTVHFTASLEKSAGQPFVVPFDQPQWSFSDPQILYGADWNKWWIDQYSFSRRKETKLFDLTEVSGVTVNNSSWKALSVSQDGQIAVAFGGDQDSAPYVVVYDVPTGTYRFLNVAAGTVYNSDTNTTASSLAVNVNGTNYPLAGKNAGIHSAEIDGSGRYVLLTLHADVPGSNFDIWDTHQNTVTSVLPNAHNDLGYGFSGGNDGGYANNWITVRLSNGHVNYSNPSPGGWTFGSHYTWSNASATTPLAPLLASTFCDLTANAAASCPSVGGTAAPWQQEIIAVCTSCPTFTVWRFANTHDSYNSSDTSAYSFWNQVRGNVSQDGKYYIFDSNWEFGLGTDPGTQSPRHDIFIVDLETAGREGLLREDRGKRR